MAVELYDEHEQSERVRSWIKEYAFSIVMGLVLAFGGIYGYGQWQSHQASQQVLAAEYFEVIQRELEDGSLEVAEDQFMAMQEAVSRNPYVGLAALAMATAYVEEGRLEPAARSYREILEQRRLESLWPVARLRLARVLQAQGDHAEALAQIQGEAPVGYQGAWAELRGDLLFADGELDQARLAYQEALDHQTGQGMGRRLIEMKIDATGPAATENHS